MYVIAHNGSAILGGGELAALRLLRGLQRRGHRVLMLMRDETMAGLAAAHGVPAAALRVGGHVSMVDAMKLAARLRRERPDAVLLTTFRKVLPAAMGARLAGVPRVIQRIGLQTDTPARGAYYRWALSRLLHAVVVNAEEMRAPFLAAAPLADPANVHTILQGVRPHRRVRAPGALRRELGIPADAPVVGAVARLARQKRLDRLVRAVALLPGDVHCVIAGDGDEGSALRRLSAELGIGARVHLAGFRRDVADVLGDVDVLAVTSDREGMSNAMLEAMALGVPVVSTPVAGAAEALRPFADGSAPGEIVGFAEDAVAAALRRLLADPAARREMGSAGRRRIAESFDYETMIDRWERVLAGHPLPHPRTETAERASRHAGAR
jgi:glycosyltransferase involved in cell wall biosynthesis